MVYKKSGQFPANTENMKKLAAQYGCRYGNYIPAESGIENSTFIIDAQIKIVIRVYRLAKKRESDVRLEVDFMQELRNQGLPVPAVIKNVIGKTLTKVNIGQNDWLAIAMEYVPGHHPESYSKRIIDQLATQQAIMHKIGIAYAQKHQAKPTLQLLPGEFTDHITDEDISDEPLRALIRRARKYELNLSKSLDFGYVHNDLDIENTLFDNKDTLKGILDFDDLAVMPAVVCLAFSLWSVLFETDSWEMVEHYIEVYRQHRKLISEELSFIPRVLLFRHYAITSLFVLDNEMTEAIIKKCVDIETLLLDMVNNPQNNSLTK